jgi:hypothetical protein
MRPFIVLAVAAFSLVVRPAAAADIGVGGATHGYGAYYGGGVRAGELIIYGVEPGVTIRAYWLPPWRNRHYFPFHGRKPRRVSARGRPKPAETYYRYWSNSGAFIDNVPPAVLRAYDSTPGRRRRTLITPNEIRP